GLNKDTVKNKYTVPLYAGSQNLISGQANGSLGTCVTTYGSYEFLVMSFGLTSAPTTFCNLMNNDLFDYLNDFVVVYVDDIVIYSRTLEEHVNHLSLVPSQLKKYTLYVNMEKCEFTQQEIKLLGHLVSKNQVRMGLKKVQAIKIHCCYSKRAAALTDLLKKDTKWNLKKAIACEPILRLPDFELPFQLHTDASDKAIG
uniref:Reverse transcriptase domain-containing protein n=1 Tax=Solanum lycopersicum TaxID=4081 RepID=A0A3Q7JBA2_SOLLC